jgi:hypothetical protein
MSKTLENLTGTDGKTDDAKGVDLISLQSKATKGSLITEWRFKKKQPFYLLNLVGNKETAIQDPAMAEGKMFVHAVKVRSWKLDLDPNNPVDALVAKKLPSHDMFGIDFWPMENAKGDESIEERASLLRHLLEMSTVQLQEMMTREEWAELGIIPNATDQMTMVVAVMGKKKIITKETK